MDFVEISERKGVDMIYGIDLGTTYSCIATLDRNGNPEIIRNQADASDTLASAVFFESADNVLIGSCAKDMVETDGERVVQFVKREIGKPNARTYEFDGKTFTPVEISALILLRLKQMVEEQGGSVEDVVITCPAYFGMEEKRGTIQACEIAGMNLLTLIPEPIAAVLSYFRDDAIRDRTVLVYDLGGATFDVSIVKMSLEKNSDGSEIQKVNIITIDGNDELGGKDWDDKLFDHILQVCCDENGLTPDEIDVETRQLIRSRVETTKKKLSNTETAKVKISVNGAMTTIYISREDFENLTSDKVAQTMIYVEKVLERVENADIDDVLLVGGSTYMPMIRETVEARFPGKIRFEEPDRAVAKGAALAGNLEYLEKIKTQRAEICKTTIGIGIENEKGYYHIETLIRKGQLLTDAKSVIVSSQYTNQRKIVLNVFESDEGRESFSLNKAHKPIGTANIEIELPDSLKSEAKVRLKLQPKKDGYDVSAILLSANVELHCHITKYESKNTVLSETTKVRFLGYLLRHSDYRIAADLIKKLHYESASGDRLFRIVFGLRRIKYHEFSTVGEYAGGKRQSIEFIDKKTGETYFYFNSDDEEEEITKPISWESESFKEGEKERCFMIDYYKQLIGLGVTAYDDFMPAIAQGIAQSIPWGKLTTKEKYYILKAACVENQDII